MMSLNRKFLFLKGYLDSFSENGIHFKEYLFFYHTQKERNILI